MGATLSAAPLIVNGKTGEPGLNVLRHVAVGPKDVIVPNTPLRLVVGNAPGMGQNRGVVTPNTAVMPVSRGILAVCFIGAAYKGQNNLILKLHENLWAT